MSVSYGPVKIAWAFHRVADYEVVVEKLRSMLPEGTQFFGIHGLCRGSSEYYTTCMVLWPRLLDGSYCQKQIQQWRDRLQEVVAELERLTLETPRPISTVSNDTAPSPDQDRWIVESRREGAGASRFVLNIMRGVHKSFLEGNVVFGEIAIEYELHGQRWRETHCATAEGRYVWSVEKV